MVEDLVKANRPPNATVYLLRDATRTYPAAGAYLLDPFQEPSKLPSGLYTVSYKEHEYAPYTLPPLVPGQPPPTIRVGDPTITAVQVSAPKEEGGMASRNVGDPMLRDEQHHRDRVSYLRTKMQDENITSEQLIGKQLLQNREVGESFVVAKAWRQEAENISRSRMLLQEENLRLAKIIQEERMVVAKPAEAPPSPMMTLATQFLGLVAPALLGKQGGFLEGILDAKIGSSPDSQMDRDTKAAKEELAVARQKLAQKNRKVKRKGQSLEQLQEDIAAAIAGLKELEAQAQRHTTRTKGRKAPSDAKKPASSGAEPAKAARPKAVPKKLQAGARRESAK